MVAFGAAAAILGALAPALSQSRPRFALAAVVLLPPLLLLARYVTFVAASDWEGMGALAFLILMAGWVIISLGTGAVVLALRRRWGTLPNAR